MTGAAWWAAVACVAAVLVIMSMPRWLPGVVVKLRVRIFALVNGDEGIQVPGGRYGPEEFKLLYADPAANGRSRGAALSDLFWYWLAPGPEVHQEHLEPGPRYDEAARATRRMLTRLRKDEWEALVARCAGDVLDRVAPSGGARVRRRGRTRAVRLRDLMMPIWAAVYYELVFGEPCPPEVRGMIAANADDVVSALKCTRLRHMARRDRLTRYLLDRIHAGTVPKGLPDLFSAQEQAYYLQGTYFNTAVVQMSEAMAHLLMVLAARPDVQTRLREAPHDTDYLDRVIDETLRVYPLFGVAHRITSSDIAVGSAVIPGGSVLLFNYPAFQHSGSPDAADFDPGRWLRDDAGQIRHIPFGVSANRPCPARGIAPLTMRVVATEAVRRFALTTSAGHTRSLPNRGPCLLTALPGAQQVGAEASQTTYTQTPDSQAADLRAAAFAPGSSRRLALHLIALRVRDRWEDVWRSIVQLVLGTYMVWDARRQRLCQNYFAAEETVQ